MLTVCVTFFISTYALNQHNHEDLTRRANYGFISKPSENAAKVEQDPNNSSKNDATELDHRRLVHKEAQKESIFNKHPVVLNNLDRFVEYKDDQVKFNSNGHVKEHHSQNVETFQLSSKQLNESLEKSDEIIPLRVISRNLSSGPKQNTANFHNDAEIVEIASNEGVKLEISRNLSRYFDEDEMRSPLDQKDTLDIEQIVNDSSFPVASLAIGSQKSALYQAYSDDTISELSETTLESLKSLLYPPKNSTHRTSPIFLASPTNSSIRTFVLQASYPSYSLQDVVTNIFQLISAEPETHKDSGLNANENHFRTTFPSITGASAFVTSPSANIPQLPRDFDLQVAEMASCDSSNAWHTELMSGPSKYIEQLFSPDRELNTLANNDNKAFPAHDDGDTLWFSPEDYSFDLDFIASLIESDNNDYINSPSQDKENKLFRAHSDISEIYDIPSYYYFQYHNHNTNNNAMNQSTSYLQQTADAALQSNLPKSHDTTPFSLQSTLSSLIATVPLYSTLTASAQSSFDVLQSTFAPPIKSTLSSLQRKAFSTFQSLTSSHSSEQTNIPSRSDIETFRASFPFHVTLSDTLELAYRSTIQHISCHALSLLDQNTKHLPATIFSQKALPSVSNLTISQPSSNILFPGIHPTSGPFKSLPPADQTGLDAFMKSSTPQHVHSFFTTFPQCIRDNTLKHDVVDTTNSTTVESDQCFVPFGHIDFALFSTKPKTYSSIAFPTVAARMVPSDAVFIYTDPAVRTALTAENDNSVSANDTTVLTDQVIEQFNSEGQIPSYLTQHDISAKSKAKIIASIRPFIETAIYNTSSTVQYTSAASTTNVASDADDNFNKIGDWTHIGHFSRSIWPLLFQSIQLDDNSDNSESNLLENRDMFVKLGLWPENGCLVSSSTAANTTTEDTEATAAASASSSSTSSKESFSFDIDIIWAEGTDISLPTPSHSIHLDSTTHLMSTSQVPDSTARTSSSPLPSSFAPSSSSSSSSLLVDPSTLPSESIMSNALSYHRGTRGQSRISVLTGATQHVPSVEPWRTRYRFIAYMVIIIGIFIMVLNYFTLHCIFSELRLQKMISTTTMLPGREIYNEYISRAMGMIMDNQMIQPIQQLRMQQKRNKNVQADAVPPSKNSPNDVNSWSEIELETLPESHANNQTALSSNSLSQPAQTSPYAQIERVHNPSYEELDLSTVWVPPSWFMEQIQAAAAVDAAPSVSPLPADILDAQSNGLYPPPIITGSVPPTPSPLQHDANPSLLVTPVHHHRSASPNASPLGYFGHFSTQLQHQQHHTQQKVSSAVSQPVSPGLASAMPSPNLNPDLYASHMVDPVHDRILSQQRQRLQQQHSTAPTAAASQVAASLAYNELCSSIADESPTVHIPAPYWLRSPLQSCREKLCRPQRRSWIANFFLNQPLRSLCCQDRMYQWLFQQRFSQWVKLLHSAGVTHQRQASPPSLPGENGTRSDLLDDYHQVSVSQISLRGDSQPMFDRSLTSIMLASPHHEAQPDHPYPMTRAQSHATIYNSPELSRDNHPNVVLGDTTSQSINTGISKPQSVAAAAASALLRLSSETLQGSGQTSQSPLSEPLVSFDQELPLGYQRHPAVTTNVQTHDDVEVQDNHPDIQLPHAFMQKQQQAPQPPPTSSHWSTQLCISQDNIHPYTQPYQQQQPQSQIPSNATAAAATVPALTSHPSQSSLYSQTSESMSNLPAPNYYTQHQSSVGDTKTMSHASPFLPPGAVPHSSSNPLPGPLPVRGNDSVQRPNKPPVPNRPTELSPIAESQHEPAVVEASAMIPNNINRFYNAEDEYIRDRLALSSKQQQHGSHSLFSHPQTQHHTQLRRGSSEIPTGMTRRPSISSSALVEGLPVQWTQQHRSSRTSNASPLQPSSNLRRSSTSEVPLANNGQYKAFDGHSRRYTGGDNHEDINDHANGGDDDDNDDDDDYEDEGHEIYIDDVHMAPSPSGPQHRLPNSQHNLRHHQIAHQHPHHHHHSSYPEEKYDDQLNSQPTPKTITIATTQYPVLTRHSDIAQHAPFTSSVMSNPSITDDNDRHEPRSDSEHSDNLVHSPSATLVLYPTSLSDSPRSMILQDPPISPINSLASIDDDAFLSIAAAPPSTIQAALRASFGSTPHLLPATPPKSCQLVQSNDSTATTATGSSATPSAASLYLHSWHKVTLPLHVRIISWLYSTILPNSVLSLSTYALLCAFFFASVIVIFATLQIISYSGPGYTRYETIRFATGHISLLLLGLVALLPLRTLIPRQYPISWLQHLVFHRAVAMIAWVVTTVHVFSKISSAPDHPFGLLAYISLCLLVLTSACRFLRDAAYSIWYLSHITFATLVLVGILLHQLGSLPVRIIIAIVLFMKCVDGVLRAWLTCKSKHITVLQNFGIGTSFVKIDLAFDPLHVMTKNMPYASRYVPKQLHMSRIISIASNQQSISDNIEPWNTGSNTTQAEPHEENDQHTDVTIDGNVIQQTSRRPPPSQNIPPTVSSAISAKGVKNAASHHRHGSTMQHNAMTQRLTGLDLKAVAASSFGHCPLPVFYTERQRFIDDIVNTENIMTSIATKQGSGVNLTSNIFYQKNLLRQHVSHNRTLQQQQQQQQHQQRPQQQTRVGVSDGYIGGQFSRRNLTHPAAGGSDFGAIASISGQPPSTISAAPTSISRPELPTDHNSIAGGPSSTAPVSSSALPPEGQTPMTRSRSSTVVPPMVTQPDNSSIPSLAVLLALFDATQGPPIFEENAHSTLKSYFMSLLPHWTPHGTPTLTNVGYVGTDPGAFCHLYSSFSHPVVSHPFTPYNVSFHPLLLPYLRRQLKRDVFSWMIRDYAKVCDESKVSVWRALLRVATTTTQYRSKSTRDVSNHSTTVSIDLTTTQSANKHRHRQSYSKLSNDSFHDDNNEDLIRSDSEHTDLRPLLHQNFRHHRRSTSISNSGQSLNAHSGKLPKRQRKSSSSLHHPRAKSSHLTHTTRNSFGASRSPQFLSQHRLSHPRPASITDSSHALLKKAVAETTNIQKQNGIRVFIRGKKCVVSVTGGENISSPKRTSSIIKSRSQESTEGTTAATAQDSSETTTLTTNPRLPSHGSAYRVSFSDQVHLSDQPPPTKSHQPPSKLQPLNEQSVASATSSSQQRKSKLTKGKHPSFPDESKMQTVAFDSVHETILPTTSVGQFDKDHSDDSNHHHHHHHQRRHSSHSHEDRRSSRKKQTSLTKLSRHDHFPIRQIIHNLLILQPDVFSSWSIYAFQRFATWFVTQSLSVQRDIPMSSTPSFVASSLQNDFDYRSIVSSPQALLQFVTTSTDFRNQLMYALYSAIMMHPMGKIPLQEVQIDCSPQAQSKLLPFMTHTPASDISISSVHISSSISAASQVIYSLFSPIHETSLFLDCILPIFYQSVLHTLQKQLSVSETTCDTVLPDINPEHDSGPATTSDHRQSPPNSISLSLHISFSSPYSTLYQQQEHLSRFIDELSHQNQPQHRKTSKLQDAVLPCLARPVSSASSTSTRSSTYIDLQSTESLQSSDLFSSCSNVSSQSCRSTNPLHVLHIADADVNPSYLPSRQLDFSGQVTFDPSLCQNALTPYLTCLPSRQALKNTVLSKSNPLTTLLIVAWMQLYDQLVTFYQSQEQQQQQQQNHEQLYTTTTPHPLEQFPTFVSTGQPLQQSTTPIATSGASNASHVASDAITPKSSHLTVTGTSSSRLSSDASHHAQTSSSLPAPTTHYSQLSPETLSNLLSRLDQEELPASSAKRNRLISKPASVSTSAPTPMAKPPRSSQHEPTSAAANRHLTGRSSAAKMAQPTHAMAFHQHMQIMGQHALHGISIITDIDQQSTMMQLAQQDVEIARRFAMVLKCLLCHADVIMQVESTQQQYQSRHQQQQGPQQQQQHSAVSISSVEEPPNHRNDINGNHLLVETNNQRPSSRHSSPVQHHHIVPIGPHSSPQQSLTSRVLTQLETLHTFLQTIPLDANQYKMSPLQTPSIATTRSTILPVVPESTASLSVRSTEQTGAIFLSSMRRSGGGQSFLRQINPLFSLDAAFLSQINVSGIASLNNEQIYTASGAAGHTAFIMKQNSQIGWVSLLRRQLMSYHTNVCTYEDKKHQQQTEKIQQIQHKQRLAETKSQRIWDNIQQERQRKSDARTYSQPDAANSDNNNQEWERSQSLSQDETTTFDKPPLNHPIPPKIYIQSSHYPLQTLLETNAIDEADNIALFASGTGITFCLSVACWLSQRLVLSRIIAEEEVIRHYTLAHTANSIEQFQQQQHQQQHPQQQYRPIMDQYDPLRHYATSPLHALYCSQNAAGVSSNNSLLPQVETVVSLFTLHEKMTVASHSIHESSAASQSSQLIPPPRQEEQQLFSDSLRQHSSGPLSEDYQAHSPPQQHTIRYPQQYVQYFQKPSIPRMPICSQMTVSQLLFRSYLMKHYLHKRIVINWAVNDPELLLFLLPLLKKLSAQSLDSLWTVRESTPVPGFGMHVSTHDAAVLQHQHETDVLYSPYHLHFGFLQINVWYTGPGTALLQQELDQKHQQKHQHQAYHHAHPQAMLQKDDPSTAQRNSSRSNTTPHQYVSHNNILYSLPALKEQLSPLFAFVDQKRVAPVITSPFKTDSQTTLESLNSTKHRQTVPMYDHCGGLHIYPTGFHAFLSAESFVPSRLLSRLSLDNDAITTSPTHNTNNHSPQPTELSFSQTKPFVSNVHIPFAQIISLNSTIMQRPYCLHPILLAHNHNKQGVAQLRSLMLQQCFLPLHHLSDRSNANTTVNRWQDFAPVFSCRVSSTDSQKTVPSASCCPVRLGHVTSLSPFDHVTSYRCSPLLDRYLVYPDETMRIKAIQDGLIKVAWSSGSNTQPISQTIISSCNDMPIATFQSLFFVCGVDSLVQDVSYFCQNLNALNTLDHPQHAAAAQNRYRNMAYCHTEQFEL